MLLFGIPLVTAIVVCLIIQFDGLYGQDSYGYVVQAGKILDWFKGGADPGSFLRPSMYPLLIALIASTGIGIALSAQIVSLMALMVISFYLRKLIREYRKEHKGGFWFVIAAILLSPFVLKASVVAMSDLTAAAFVIAFIWHVRAYRRRFKTKDLVLLLVFSSFAFFTRYATAFVILPAAFWVVKCFMINGKWRDIIYILIPGIFVMLYTSIFDLNLEHQWLINWHPQNFIKNSFCTTSGCLEYPLPNILYVLFPFGHPGFSVLTAILAFVIVRHGITREDWFWISIIGIYLLFLAGVPYQNTRYEILIFPIVVMWVYPKFNALRIPKVYARIILLFGFIIQTAFIGYYFEQLLRRNKLEKEIALYLNKQESQVIYSFDVDIAMRYRAPNHNYINLRYAKPNNIAGGELLLVNREQVHEQWSEFLPGKNLDLIEDKFTVKLVTAFEGGFKIFKITEQHDK